MNPIEVLREDHELIERELFELDFIMSDKAHVNYSNLVHTFWKVCDIWDKHELMEEELFVLMKSEGFEIPIEFVMTDHKSLRGRIKAVSDAINSGSDFRVRQVLGKELKELVGVMRRHMEREDAALTGIIVEGFSDVGLEKMKIVVGRFRA